jgi:uncharacterized cupin superfamily protein
VLDPGRDVPAEHIHLHQEERFRLLDGATRMRIGGVEQNSSRVMPVIAAHTWAGSIFFARK